MNTEATPEPSEPNPLSPKQVLAITELLLGKNISEVAATVGVDSRTIFRWQKQTEFRNELFRQEDALLASLSRDIQNSCRKALRTLEAMMEDPECPHGVRQRSAQTIFGVYKLFREDFLQTVRGRDVVELLRRNGTADRFEKGSLFWSGYQNTDPDPGPTGKSPLEQELEREENGFRG